MKSYKILAFILTITLSGILPASMAFADDITNNLDATVDASLETMNLNVGGSSGSVQFRIIPKNGDGKSGCNLTSSSQLTVSVNSSDAGVTTVSPSTLTFNSCGDTPSVTVTATGAGSSTISLAQTSNTTGATFNFAPASFTVNVIGDITAPTLTLPANITVEATGPAGAIVTFSATANDANPANPLVTCTPSSGSTFPLGDTAVACSATDAAGNTAHGNFMVSVVDTTPPSVSCDLADGLWHADNVGIHCTASDSGSGLSNSGDNSFSLFTSTSSGTEDSDVVTESRAVCDISGNCTIAGPIDNNKIDRKAPTIIITTPSATYTFHQNIPADYTCTDNGSGLASCTGSVPNGSAFDTTTLGLKHFTVDATDNVANESTLSSDYTVVGYSFGGLGTPLTISKTDFKKMSTIPVKFKLSDTFGNSVSNAIATLKINGVSAVSSGNANTANLFRYDASGQQYIFNLSTKLVQLGLNTLVISLDDGTTYSWAITIR